ncbi:hypothetical protein BLL40_04730 [Domibacillus mangrovi]|uniref:Peptidase S8/S53 domain-containing protein n=1 Tax=Domibacillus mangrovi TaxID=1714354 RepID=A0A1Q5P5Z3_9BACI|nr:hypothetical protein BLL40_04730 [Domibacillus mangrovi]
MPDSEVEELDHKPRFIPTQLNIDHVNHGGTLFQGIQEIEAKHNAKKTPISEELVIFKVTLEEDEQADARGDYKKIFENNNLKINAIKKSNEAIVSSTPADFKEFTDKLNSYIDEKGRSQDFFQYIKSISKLDVADVQTKRLIEKKVHDQMLDMQVTLLPKLEKDVYEKMISYLLTEVKKVNGELGEDGLYYLSDNTPVLRILLPSSGVDIFTDQEIILKAEPSPFFDVSEKRNGHPIDISTLPLEVESDLGELPIVCILDNGIRFPENIENCIADRWVADGITDFTAEHGTKVASRAVFGDNLDEQVKSMKLNPRVRVIDAVIHDGISPLYEGTLVKRIQEAVKNIKVATTTFCLSFNDENPIEDYTVGNLAYEIDCLSREGINFALPTGNHKLWKVYDNLEHIADDSSSRLAAPAESFFGVTVGSITRDEHKRSMSRKRELSPFSRIGFGFSGSNKPDLVYPGGNIYRDEEKAFIAANSAAYVINNEGFLIQDFGTSYSAPLAAADIALLTQVVPNQDPLIARGLLMHHAQESEHLIENPEIFERMYGCGIGNYENAKDSYKDRATFIRKGSMSRLVKQRVRFWMPSTLSEHSKKGAPVSKVTVTCLSLSPVDKGMGSEYLRGYIDASFHMINSSGTAKTQNPKGKKGRKPWSHVHHFSQVFTVFNPGDWQIWLQLYTKPEIVEDIDYVLIVTIENLTQNDVDVHGAIENEAESRFQTLTEVQVGYEDIG